MQSQSSTTTRLYYFKHNHDLNVAFIHFPSVLSENKCRWIGWNLNSARRIYLPPCNIIVTAIKYRFSSNACNILSIIHSCYIFMIYTSNLSCYFWSYCFACHHKGWDGLFFSCATFTAPVQVGWLIFILGSTIKFLCWLTQLMW